MAKQLACRLALIAFGTAMVRGMFVGADLSGALKNGLFGAASFFAMGLIVGELARRIVEESVEAGLTKSDTEAQASGS